MSPNKQGRKQRTRGKNNNNNVARERTVLTLAEDPASAPPYMLPTQTPFTPALGSMFAPFHQQQGQQQPPSVSIPDMTGFPFQQQPNNMMHPFGQGSPLYHMQAFHNQNQAMPQVPQQNSGEMSDLEKLRKLQKTILDGQHPFFRAVPNPEALASIYLGPSPASQVHQQQGQQQHQPQHQSAQLGHGPGSLSQSESENANDTGLHKPDPSAQLGSAPVLNATNRPQTPKASSELGTSRASGSLPTPQSVPPGASLPSVIHHQAQNAPNGASGEALSDSSSAIPHPNVAIPPKSHDFRTNTPSPLPPNSAKASAAFPFQRPSVVHSSGASGVNHEQGRVPPPTSATTTTTSLNDGAGAERKPSAAEMLASFKEAHSKPGPPAPYDRERERDRERPGYPPHDVPRYPQVSDRRDSGRYAPRNPDSRFDRDRDWERGREWDRERERERERGVGAERDRDRRRIEDKLADERRLEYERSGRLPLDRRPPPPSPVANVDQKPLPPSDQRPVPGLGPPPDQRRPEVLAHPDQRRPDVPPHPEQQQRHPDPVLPRAGPPPPPPPPSSVEQRRPDTSIPPFSGQSAHDRDRSHVPSGVPFSRSVPPASAGAPLPLPRSEQRPVLAPPPIDDHGSLRSVPPDQRASSGNNGLRSGPPSPERNRRPESGGNPADRGVGRPTGGHMDNNGPSRSLSERHPTHPGDPPPPRASVVPESRVGAGHDARDAPRPFYSHATGPPPPRAISRAPSPGPRRPGDTSYDTARDRPVPATTYREPPPPPPPPAGPPLRGYPDDLRRKSLETNASRRLSDNYYPPPPPPSVSVPPVIDRRETEARQWRERESYPPASASYAGTDAERERARRYPETREWHGDAYARDRDPRAGDVDAHPRGRPPPPASWDRDRPVDARDKDKERDRYDGWSGVDRKYPPPDVSTTSPPPPPSRWEEPTVHGHRPLHARLTDTYDDRFVSRDAAERARYPPPSPSEDVPMRDGFRENPRVRPRSPSPAGRPPGGFDDAHRAKRAREEYETPPRPPYYDDARRPGPAAEYPARAASPPYYDPRAPAMPSHRDPSPYARDRALDPYPRRDMPPPRSPPYYGRERYPPR